MKFGNGLEQKVSHRDEEMVKCTYKMCKTYGEFIYCYFDIYENCDRYIRMQNDVRNYVRRTLKKKYLKNKKI